MAINWFEGGRRISWLIMGVAVAGGLFAVLSVEKPKPEFTTHGPEAPWIVSDSPCPDDAHVSWNWDYL